MIQIFIDLCKRLSTIFIGQADNALYALILFVILDYITGVCAAIQERSLSSQIGASGIAKKTAIFLVVSVSHVADWYLMNQEDVLRTLTVMFYLSNEGISILENIGRIGVPLPEKLTAFLKHLKNFNNGNNKNMNL